MSFFLKNTVSFVSIFKILSGDAQNKIFAALNDCQDPTQKQEMEVMARNQLSFIHEILNNCHVSVLQDLLERITSIVDQEATIDAKDSVVIHHGFHEELDNAKESFDTLDGKYFYCSMDEHNVSLPSCIKLTNLSCHHVVFFLIKQHSLR